MEKGLIKEAKRLQELAGISIGIDPENYKKSTIKLPNVVKRIDKDNIEVNYRPYTTEKSKRDYHSPESVEVGGVTYYPAIVEPKFESGDPDLDDDPNYWNLTDDQWDAIEAGEDPDEVRFGKYDDPDARRDAKYDR